MRSFSVDSPEYFCFKIGEEDETVYKIPLGTSMNNREVKVLNEINGDYQKQVEWLRSYIGDVVDDLTVAVTNDICNAWNAATMSKGASMGES